jgi:hypothetical protein
MIGSNIARFQRESGSLLPALRGTDPSTAGRLAIATSLARLPKPVYAEDDAFALPWFATANSYPTVVVDPIFHDLAQARGLLGSGLDGMIEDRRFETLVLPPSSPRMAVAIRAGYRALDPPPAGDSSLRILIRAR